MPLPGRARKQARERWEKLKRDDEKASRPKRVRVTRDAKFEAVQKLTAADAEALVQLLVAEQGTRVGDAQLRPPVNYSAAQQRTSPLTHPSVAEHDTTINLCPTTQAV